MKKVWGFLAIVLICCSFVFAQEKSKGIGGGVGTNFLVGDSPIGDSQISPNFGLYGIYGLSRKLDLKLQVGIGQFGVKSSHRIHTTSFIPIELFGLYSLSPGSKFNPFLHLGFGAMRFSVNDSPSYYDGLAIGGLGFKYAVNSSWTWLISADMRYTTGDGFNGHNGGMGDGYFNMQYGLTYNLNKDKQKYERKDKLKEKQILAQHYVDQQKVLLKTQLENIRVEIIKLEQELNYLGKMVGVHVNNVDDFTNKLYNYALNVGQEEQAKVLAVMKEEDEP
jgi:hypothetical protein